MTDATWAGGAMNPDIDWRMSASLANAPRGDTDVAEVASLERAVRDWLGLDAYPPDAELPREEQANL